MVKTRLASSMGEDFALGLYSSFIKDILTMSGSVRADKIIVIDGHYDAPTHLLDLGTGYRMIRQKGEDIGIRMLNAFLQIFDLGYHRAVLIGSDSPDLPAELIEKAIISLITEDIVLGRSTDGGYYLIGFKKETCSAEYFSGISWSTPLVFQQTIKKIVESKKSVSLLPDWIDIDDRGDLKLFYDETLKRADTSLHTMKYLTNSIKNKHIFFN